MKKSADSATQMYISAHKRLAGVQPPERVHRQGRARLEALLKDRFNQSLAQRKKAVDSLAPLRAPFTDIVKGKKDYQHDVQNLLKLPRKQRLIAPKVRPVKPRIFSGSVNVIAVPPFLWPWTWTANNGNSIGASANADNNSGQISFEVTIDQGGSGAAATAVGTFIQPLTPDGMLTIQATPSLSYAWSDAVIFDSAHVDGWLGLYVGAYTLDWTQYDVPVDQQIYLYNQNPSFYDNSFNQGSNSGFPLSASIVVNGSSLYEVWVWAGGSASADGYHGLWGSVSDSALTVNVPSISMTLF